jgi:hypothetical protein
MAGVLLRLGLLQSIGLPLLLLRLLHLELMYWFLLLVTAVLLGTALLLDSR